ncbi:MAG: ABC transporter ATP-binding protein [Deltaproteobacteria bacterium]|jgi:iron complex transport system ATP-binding protein|nr:ABC transporter ATP-binding protein [Deltaproteobacteria bacterium]
MEIRAHGVKVALDGTEILRGVEATLGAARLTGIIGPNGSGKSTLLKTFYKAITPISGYVSYGSEPLKDISQRRCARMTAVLPQNQDGASELGVMEIVMMGRYPYKGFMDGFGQEDRRMAGEALARLGLAAFAKRKFRTLSGGERQLALLARALVQDTPWLLLDEPTNHLDIQHQLRLLDSLGELDKRMVVVFHDLSLASKYCDQLFVMKGGLIAAQGAPRDIMTPGLIREVYNVEALVMAHPLGGWPVVLL